MTPRKDVLTSQKVEVALIFQEMMGTLDALAYLRSVGVCIAVTERVLSGRLALRRGPCPLAGFAHAGDGAARAEIEPGPAAHGPASTGDATK